ncbi:MAG: crossover junction endodeoxyribonuclease RuvC [Candidatus Schekmanbacteria bacterium RBG_13_48_7]|uniref:Crossover junction endodeoxyribonuclease RuvC n=1 Tax=Candidatus Schekmanbacteria bacterium RBG_13_48_7 TaxID=1817878 RepID=A0A1F7RRH6_9BACT|nr:MAG: crossover junction endodeoxyribonuclease RuvC [Candidatus Schekmanbacteria bacterium RBG_13_48_7]
MGVDPGLTRTGYGIIDIINDRAFLVHLGVINNSGPKKSLPEKLFRIYNKMIRIISDNHPSEMVIEEVFYAQNVQSAFKLGQARAAAILAGINCELKIHEYSALEVKKSITSYGRATKEQVQHMVKILLKLDEIPRYNDSSDALALSLCHFHSMKYRNLTKTATTL